MDKILHKITYLEKSAKDTLLSQNLQKLTQEVINNLSFSTKNKSNYIITHFNLVILLINFIFA
jgi:hypothetical protein